MMREHMRMIQEMHSKMGGMMGGKQRRSDMPMDEQMQRMIGMMQRMMGQMMRQHQMMMDMQSME